MYMIAFVFPSSTIIMSESVSVFLSYKKTIHLETRSQQNKMDMISIKTQQFLFKTSYKPMLSENSGRKKKLKWWFFEVQFRNYFLCPTTTCLENVGLYLQWHHRRGCPHFGQSHQQWDQRQSCGWRSTRTQFHFCKMTSQIKKNQRISYICYDFTQEIKETVNSEIFDEIVKLCLKQGLQTRLKRL